MQVFQSLRFIVASGYATRHRLLAVFFILGCGNAAKAQTPVTYYWDLNGTTANTAIAVTGAWNGTNAFWNSDSTGGPGGTTTAAPTQNDNLVFNSGSLYTTGTVTATGTQLANSISFKQNIVMTLAGGTINLGGGSGGGSGYFVLSGDNSANTISSATILNSAATALSFSNAGTAAFTIGAVTGSATTGTQTITVGSSSSGGMTLNGIIANGANGGNVAINVSSSGTGATVVSGANTFSGGTTISAGTIRVSTSDAALGTGALTFVANGTLATASGGGARNIANAVTISNGVTATFDGGFANLTLSGAITGAGNLTQTSSGFVILTNAANNYAGVTNVLGSGTLQFSRPGALYNNVTSNWTAANITVQSGATLAVNAGGATDFTPANIATLLGNLTSGTASNGFLANSAFAFDTTNSAGVVSYTNALVNSTAGAVRLTKIGTGTLALSGPNTYTGFTTITTGTLRFANQVSLYNNITASWTAANIKVASGGTFAVNVGGVGEFTNADVTTLLTTLDGAITSNGLQAGSSIGFDTTNAPGGTFTIGDTIANTSGTGGGAVGVTKLGTGTLNLTGTNTYTGSTLVGAGTLVVPTSTSLQNSGFDTSGAGVLVITANPNTPTFGGLVGGGNPARSYSSAYATTSSITLTPPTGTTNTFTGIMGNGAPGMTLTINGLGTQNLGGSLSYTGVTTVLSGTVNVTGNSSGATGGWNIGNNNNTSTQSVTFASSSLVAVASTGTFQLGATGASGAAASLSVSGFVSNAGALNVQRTASFTIASGGAWFQTGAVLIGAPSGSGNSTASTISSGGVFAYSGPTAIQINPALNGSGNTSLTISGTFFTNQAFSDAIATTSGSGVANLTLTGGTIVLTSNIASLVTSAGTTFNFATGTVGGTINSNGFTTSIDRVISGTIGATFTGGGTVTLSAANTYSGTTTVGFGTLSLTGSVASTSLLSFGGGTLSAAPSAGGGTGNTQTVVSTSLAAGGSSAITITAGNTLALGAITRTLLGGTLNFPTVGTVTTTSANSNGILGAWATYGAGGTMLYATGTGSTPFTIAGYSGGTAAATAAGLTDTTGAVNYDLADPTGTIGVANFSGNTIRFTGSTTAAGTLAPGATSFNLNGLMNTSTGLLTIGTNTVTIGANKDLVITGPGNVTISSIIANNAGGASAVTYSGTGTLILSGANSYTGTTYVNSGTILVSNRSSAALAMLYVVAQGATLNLGYGIAQATGNSGVTVNGNGVNATTGLYLAGGLAYNFQSPLTLQTAPTTIRAYGTGIPSLLGYDINGIHLNVATAASGSVIPATINISTGSFGYRMTIAAGPNNANGDLTIGGVISGSGSVAKNGISVTVQKEGNGSLLLTGASTITNGIYVAAGSLILSGGANRLPGATQVVLGDGSAGGARLILNGIAQTLGNLNAFGTGSYAVMGGSATASTLTLSPTATITFAGSIGGSGTNQNNIALVKAAAGTLVLTGTTNTYTGSTTVNGGTLNLGVANAIAASSSITLANTAGVLLDSTNSSQSIASLAGGGTTGGNVSMGIGDLTLTGGSNASYGGVISGSGSLIKSGSAIQTLTGVQAYSGATSLTGGTLKLGVANAIASTSGVTLANTAGVGLDSTNFSQSIPGLAGGGTTGGNVTMGSGNLTLAGGVNTGYGGVISGSGSLVKSGTAIQILTGANTYTGSTTISGGTLALAASGSIASSSITVGNTQAASTSIFDISGLATPAYSIDGGKSIGGHGTVNTGNTGSITVASGATIAPGSAAIGTLTVGTASTTGQITLTGGSQMSIKYDASAGPSNNTTLVPGVSHDLLAGSTGSTLTLVGLNADGNGIAANPIIINLSALNVGPDPGSLDPQAYTFATFTTIASSDPSVTLATSGSSDVSGLFTAVGGYYGTPTFNLSGTGGAAQSLSVTFIPVPEPSSLLACGSLILGGGWAFRRRRAKRIGD